MKNELFRIPILAPIIRSLGAIPVDRGGSDVKAIRRSIDTIKNGDLFAVFPQGHRYPKTNPADTPIKNGIGLIAHRAQAAVIPVCIKIKNQKYRLFRRTNVLIGKPISIGKLGLHKGGNEAYAAAAKIAFDELCELGGFHKSESAETSDS